MLFSLSLFLRPFLPLVGQGVDLSGKAGQLLVGDGAAGGDDLLQARAGRFQRGVGRGGALRLLTLLLGLLHRDGDALRLLRILPGQQIEHRAGVGRVGREAVLDPQAARVILADLGLAVVDEDHSRLFPECADPAQEAVLVRMAALAWKIADLAVDGDILVEQGDLLCAVPELSAERADCLIAHEEHHALFSPEIVLQVMADAAGLAHAARGDDQLRLPVKVDGLALLRADGEHDAGAHQRIDPAVEHAAGRGVEVSPVALEEDAGRLVRQRRVHVDREITVAADHMVDLDLADEIQDLLRAPDSKAGDHQIPAAVQHALDAVGKESDVVHVALLVEPPYPGKR